MNRRFVGKFVLLAVLLMCVTVCGFLRVSGYAADVSTCTTYSGSNVEDQDYNIGSSPVRSYLSYDNGTYMRFQAGAVAGGYLVEYYDSDFKLTSRKVVANELDIFGGFCQVGNYYYVLSGQKNEDESDSVEVFRVTKYNKNWGKQGSCGLNGANTYIPFDAGSARMAVYGNYLLIRTCHKMYSHHQANVTIQVDMSSMKIVDSFTSVMNVDYGYVSHSFNQFIQMENGCIVGVDHGDANPRSVVLVKYPSAVSASGFRKYGCKATDIISFSGEIGAN